MTRHELPTIVEEGADGDRRRWRFPLTETAARALVELLLASDPPAEAVTPQLAVAMRADPVLLLWSICRAEGEPISSVDAAAAWLARAGGEAIHFEAERSARESSDDPATSDARWMAELHTACVAGATARTMAQTAPQEIRDAVELAALLGSAANWFDRAAVAPRTADQATHGENWPRGYRDVRARLDGDPAVGEYLRAVERAAVAGDLPNEEIDGDDFARRLLPRLARMVRLETAFDQTLEEEKLESLAEFAAGAGHEINNPLAVISARAQLLMREETHPRRRRELGVIHTQALRVTEMISDMMLFARPPEPERERLDLSACVAEWSRDWQARADEAGVRLESTAQAEPVWVTADVVQLRVAVGAIVQNSLEAAGEGGSVRIDVAEDGSPVERVLVRVQDDGPGLPDEVRRHVFDPFYSGRQAGRGIGMGMSKCWRIVQLHGGDVTIHAPSGGGTEVAIALPVAAVEAHAIRRSA